MADFVIGLHIYAVRQHLSRSPSTVALAPSGNGARLTKYCPTFFDRYSKQVDGGSDGRIRSWYLEPEPNNGKSFHGIIRYGSSGFSEEIRDRKTREVKYNRVPSDIGTIPLYYRMWVPDKGEYALLGLQTFGIRSCVGLFTQAFLDGYRGINDGYHLTFTPVVPAQLASFKSAQVKSFSLIKHDYSSDAAENQLEPQNELVNLSVSFKAKRRYNLGPLSTFTEKIKNLGKSEVLEYNDTEFDEAVAEVLIKGKKRKVTLIGLSRDAGKFDLTDDVQRTGTGGHPVLSSIADEVERIFTDVVTS